MQKTFKKAAVILFLAVTSCSAPHCPKHEAHLYWDGACQEWENSEDCACHSEPYPVNRKNCHEEFPL